MARVVANPSDYGNTAWDSRRCQEFVVEDFVSAEEADDGVAFYWGSDRGGINNVTAPAEACELVRSAEAMAARTLPSATEIRRAISSSLCGMSYEGIEIDETEPGGDASVLAYGETHDGLRFGLEVTVSRVFHADF